MGYCLLVCILLFESRPIHPTKIIGNTISDKILTSKPIILKSFFG